MLTNLQSINVLTGGIKCTHVACARKTGGTHNEVADSSKCLNHLFRILTDTKACELHQYVTFLQNNRTSVHLTAKLETYRSCSTKITSGAESSAWPRSPSGFLICKWQEEYKVAVLSYGTTPPGSLHFFLFTESTCHTTVILSSA